MEVKRWELIYGVALLLLALLFLPRMLFGDSTFYTEILTSGRLLAVASLAKIAFLALASYYGARCLSLFGRGNPVRPAWILLTLGLVLYLGGQLALGYYQLFLGVATPFPSVADAFFIPSMVFLIAALFAFLTAYGAAGYPGSGLRETLPAGLVLLAVVGLLAFLLLRPVLAQQAPPSERWLNVAYPLLDCLLLVPGLLLVRVTSMLRGGRLWRVWMLLLLGFLCVATGDILFAYFTALELEALDPLLDFVFAAAYVFFAWGTHQQLDVSTE